FAGAVFPSTHPLYSPPSLPPHISLHDALPTDLLERDAQRLARNRTHLRGNHVAEALAELVEVGVDLARPAGRQRDEGELRIDPRSEEHTSELQSRENLVFRLLLEKKKRKVERE